MIDDFLKTILKIRCYFWIILVMPETRMIILVHQADPCVHAHEK